MPRIFSYLFEEIQKSKMANTGEVWNCHLSYMQIYNERISDLLNPEASASDNLKVCDTKGKGIYVKGLSDTLITNAADAIALLEKGAKNRKVGSTEMNAQSSRSHTILSLALRSTKNGVSQFSRM